MDVVLVGLPGSGKSAVGRRLAHRHGASFIDLDESIEKGAGRTIPEIFAQDGEAAFRQMERAAVAGLGPADPDPRFVGSSQPVAERSSTRATGGRSIAIAFQSGSTDGRRSSLNVSDAARTSGRSLPGATRSVRSGRWPGNASASMPPATG